MASSTALPFATRPLTRDDIVSRYTAGRVNIGGKRTGTLLLFKATKLADLSAWLRAQTDGRVELTQTIKGTAGRWLVVDDPVALAAARKFARDRAKAEHERRIAGGETGGRRPEARRRVPAPLLRPAVVDAACRRGHEAPPWRLEHRDGGRRGPRGPHRDDLPGALRPHARVRAARRAPRDRRRLRRRPGARHRHRDDPRRAHVPGDAHELDRPGHRDVPARAVEPAQHAPRRDDRRGPAGPRPWRIP